MGLFNRDPCHGLFPEPETSIYKWLFQLDDSKSVHKKCCFTLHPLRNGCLGFQVIIPTLLGRISSAIYPKQLDLNMAVWMNFCLLQQQRVSEKRGR